MNGWERFEVLAGWWHGRDTDYSQSDPTGVSDTITAENGEFIGRLLYDGFGAVLTNTMPVSRTNILPNLPDAASGLVHLGDGRWYDPAWGRPLQPNTDSNLPTIPQALNRFTATPVGQPGVLQVANQPHEFVIWAQQQVFFKIPVSKLVGKYVFDPQFGNAISQVARATGWLRVKIRAEKRLVPARLGDLTLVLSESPGPKRRVRGFFQDGFHFRSAFLSDDYNLVTLQGRIHRSNLLLSDIALFDDIDILERESKNKFVWSSKAILADLSLGVLLDVGFQLSNDLDNPYLTGTQKLYRSGVAATGAILSGGIGLGISSGLIAVGIASGPAGWTGLVVGLAADWYWNDKLTPLIYDSLELNPTRQLQPFGGTP